MMSKTGISSRLKSLVMLKNHNHMLPIADSKKKVFIPKRHFPSVVDFFGNKSKDYWAVPIDLNMVKKYYDVVDNPADADFSIVVVEGPMSGSGYSADDVKAGGNGYVPISLQYNDYTATDARDVSIAGGDPKETFTNRSYRGKTVKTANRDDLQLVQQTKKHDATASCCSTSAKYTNLRTPQSSPVTPLCLLSYSSTSTDVQRWT